MYAVGNELPFPGWWRCNEYNDSTLLMSLTNSEDVRFFSDFKNALEFAGSEMLIGHSSPRTSLPLGMRAIFEVSGEKVNSGAVRIKKITKACLPDPHKPDSWKILNFDASRSIYENSFTIECGLVFPTFFTHRINLVAENIR